jgi:hypothetical protein
MSSSASRRGRRADRKNMPPMPDSVRRSVEQIATDYGMSPQSVFNAMCALFSKTLPGNRCVGCNETILESPAALYAINDSPKGAVGSVCPACAERYQYDDKFAAKIDSEGYRAAHGAGPDDVGGTA